MEHMSRYTDDDLKEAVRESISYRQVLVKLGMFAAGGNYKQVQKRIRRADIDTSHFKGQSHGTSGFKMQRPIEEYLVYGSDITSSSLKKKLIRAGLLEERCANGHEAVWMGRKLILHLDHINGDNMDNRLENLQMLCPNCHSITETYCRGLRVKHVYHCACGKRVSKKARRCFECSLLNRPARRNIVVWPTLDVLRADIKGSSTEAVAAKLGVTERSVRRHLQESGAKERI